MLIFCNQRDDKKVRSKKKFEENRSYLPPALYIRIFDILFEVNCVLLWKKRMFKNALPCDPARYILTSEVFSKHERHPLVVLKLLSFFN